MGTGKPGATATFSISGDVATDATMTESTTEAGTYSGSYTVTDVVVDGTYSATVTVSSDTTAESGDKVVVVTAKDLAGNSATAEVAVSLTTFSAFDLVIPKGIGLVHIPLSVTEVGGEKKELNKISDLYDAVGEAGSFLITYDVETGAWRSYLGASSKDTASDAAITDDLGIK